MYQIIKSFLKTRVTSIELNGYKSPTVQIDIGVPQGSVLSPLLFIIFLNYFISNQAQKFKFADDSSLIATGKDPSELSAILRKTCSDIEKWWADWRMLVNGGKIELFFFNCEENDVELPCLNGDISQVKKTTKSLGVIIDSKLNYRDHSTKTIERAKRNWNIIKSLCIRKWSHAVPTLVLLYKTTILPSLFYAAPIWLAKNLKYVTAVQNNFKRTVFRHGFSPNIDSCQVLLGTPPLDLLSTAINVKFLSKFKLEDDLLHWTMMHPPMMHLFRTVLLTSSRVMLPDSESF